MNPFDDPVFGFYCIQQVVCNLFLDKIINVIISQLLWKPRDNSLYRAFTRSVESSLKRREYLEGQEKFRQWFFNRHTLYSINKLTEIFTPRARNAYKMKLNQLYQTALALQPTHTYMVPPEAFPPRLARDELPDDLREEMEVTDSSDSEERDAILDSSHPALQLPGQAGDDLGVVMQRRGRRGNMVGGLAALTDPDSPRSLASGDSGKLSQPEDEDFRKLLSAPDEESMLELGGQGFGSMAALISSAWLLSARRHIQMNDLAASWAEDMELLEGCQACNRQEDPMIIEGLGHGKGLKLEVTVVGDVPKLVVEFERQYNVPEDPFDEKLWREFLQTHESWQTLCERCRKARAATQRSQGAFAPALRPAVPAPALSDSPGSDDGTPRRMISGSEDSEDEEVARKTGEVPADWFDVQVSPVSRQQILLWASMARKRVKRKEQWQDYRDFEDEQGHESRPINETIRREGAHLEAGDHSDEELIESVKSQSYSSSQSGSGSFSGSGSGSRSGSGSELYEGGR